MNTLELKTLRSSHKLLSFNRIERQLNISFDETRDFQFPLFPLI